VISGGVAALNRPATGFDAFGISWAPAFSRNAKENGAAARGVRRIKSAFRLRRHTGAAAQLKS